MISHQHSSVGVTQQSSFETDLSESRRSIDVSPQQTCGRTMSVKERPYHSALRCLCNNTDLKTHMHFNTPSVKMMTDSQIKVFSDSNWTQGTSMLDVLKVDTLSVVTPTPQGVWKQPPEGSNLGTNIRILTRGQGVQGASCTSIPNSKTTCSQQHPEYPAHVSEFECFPYECFPYVRTRATRLQKTGLAIWRHGEFEIRIRCCRINLNV